MTHIIDGRTWVVGIDGSAASTHALETALKFVHKHDDVVLVHVHGCNRNPGAEHASKDQHLLTDAEALATKALPSNSVRIEFIESSAAPGDALVTYALHHSAYCIVLGTKGVTGLIGALLGSVSDFVVRHADRNVLLVPPPPEKPHAAAAPAPAAGQPTLPFSAGAELVAPASAAASDATAPTSSH
jgi:nucleotide-binding universal stress UspA family protein